MDHLDGQDNSKDMRPRVERIVWDWGYGPGHSFEQLEHVVILQQDLIDEYRAYIIRLKHRADRAEGLLRGAIANSLEGDPQ